MHLERSTDRDKRKIKISLPQRGRCANAQRPLHKSLLHQAANGLGISGGVIHGQTLNQLCLCVQQGAVLVQLLGVTGFLCGLQGSKHGVVHVQLQHLSADGPLSIEMEKVLSKQPGSEGVKSDKVLELNINHPVFAVLKAAQEAGDTDKVKKYSSLLYAQAQLIEGLPVDDPAAYAEAVCSLMK